jgi:hypothetical protein
METRQEDRTRLSKGHRITLGKDKALFVADAVSTGSRSGRRTTRYRQTDQHLIGSFAATLARTVTTVLERVEEDRLTLLDLSGIEEADPRELVNGIRAGIREARPAGSAGEGPRWSAGRRFVALRWQCGSERAEILRAGFEMLWELEDRRRPSERIPVPFLTETGTRVLGQLPPLMGGARIERLIDTRVLTYHTLIVAPDAPGNSAKAAGRELLRYERLGLLVRREYPTMAELAALGIPEPDTGRARPRVWESVLAAARALFPR